MDVSSHRPVHDKQANDANTRAVTRKITAGSMSKRKAAEDSEDDIRDGSDDDYDFDF
jgi:hypothetical protein